MKRSRTPVTPSTTTPVKSPPTPKKKTNLISVQQMQAAFLHVTQPVTTTPSPPPTQSTVAPKTPTKRKAPPKSKPTPPTPPKSKTAPPKQNLPSPPPPSPPSDPPISPEAADFLFRIDPLRFTPTLLLLNNYRASQLQPNHFRASLLSPSSPDYTSISTYITNSQAHTTFKINLTKILKITRPSPPPFIPSSSIDSIPSTSPPSKPFTMMLWHGTRPQYLSSILSNGFVCPSTPGHQMFGQGVYFADRISKSAHYTNPAIYCAAPLAGDKGYLFLCEVVLGKIYNAKKSNSQYKSAPTASRADGTVMTFDSLMCTGARVPDREEQKEIDGVVWPLGKTIDNKKFPSYTVNYNEYIVYRPAEMVDIKYLVEVEFAPKGILKN